MFAGESNIFINGNDLDDLSHIINNEMNSVSDWFSANLLSLN